MVSYIYEAIGNILGEQRPVEELGDPIDFEPGILLDSGISWVHIFKVLIPASASLIADKSGDKSTSKKQPETLTCKPSELPIYTEAESSTHKAPIDTKSQTPNVLEEAIGIVRHNLTKVFNEIRAYERVGADYVEQTKDNAQWLVKYLRQEDNTTPKAGAIAIGGLTGFVLGLRGRFFKRTVYASTGALSMAALCYPKEAREYSATFFTELSKYATIALNFAYGVKKDEPPIRLPKFPSSVSDIWSAFGSKSVSITESEEKQQIESEGKQNEKQSEKEVNIELNNAQDIVSKTHETSMNKSCHCPVGECLGHHEQQEEVVAVKMNNNDDGEKVQRH